MGIFVEAIFSVGKAADYKSLNEGQFGSTFDVSFSQLSQF